MPKQRLKWRSSDSQNAHLPGVTCNKLRKIRVVMGTQDTYCYGAQMVMEGPLLAADDRGSALDSGLFISCVFPPLQRTSSSLNRAGVQVWQRVFLLSGFV